MLADYNKSPYDLATRSVTVEEIFNGWMAAQENSGKRADNTLRAAKVAWSHCNSVALLPYRALRAYHIQSCMDGCGGSYASKNAIRTLFVNLDKFALERDIVEKCYASLVESIPIPESQKTIFTQAEISRIWENADMPGIEVILILLYSGWRIGELLELCRADIDLEANTMRGGTKTKSGKNRIVPIHPKILSIIEKRYRAPGEKLFCESQSSVRKAVERSLKALGIDRTPHECRHTFRSALDSAGANKVCIDLLMGHASQGTGERVYTHKNIDELRVTINMLNY
jgi:integrase